MGTIARFSGRKLRVARRSKRLSRYKLAVAMNCTPQTIQNWEQGTHVPNAEYLVRLAEKLGEGVEYFFDEK